MTSREATDGRAQADFLRGADEGARLAQASVPLPPLQGGPYAVGLLYGYRSTTRTRVGADGTSPPQPDQQAPDAPVSLSPIKENGDSPTLDRTPGVGPIPGQSQQELVDQSLQDEIAALADVMLAVANASGHLSQGEIDNALGVSPEPDDKDEP
jgi:hypothetical protein